MTNTTTEKYIEAVQWCSKAFDFLNDKFFENALSKPVITISPDDKKKYLGWFVCKEIWKDGEKDKGNTEINITSTFLNRSALELIETMLHEMCHLFAYQHKIKDCSRSGIYHNKKFQIICENHGLDCKKAPSIGYSVTSLTPEGKETVQKFLTGNEKFIYRLPLEKGKKIKSSSTRKYICPQCQSSVRATKQVNILCGDCDEPMLEEE